ncbi:endolytic transglycosylase MltG [Tissierella pigra]|uniref:Endolytic murein transglycosylase n=2 Tax=Tissierella pigra TaxID=2607614 RepID=A0A6N7XVQ5_9FIRM|nr:endolytic transglycosylase MltG [Tissierella pigra]MST99859.1 endolytic transglycosylase MltG [Tissierella pigra]
MEKAKMRKSRKRRFSIFILFIVLLVSGVFMNNYYKEGLKAMNPDDPSDVLVVIPSSSSVNTISNILYENKLIKNPIIFKIKVKTSNTASTLKAGEYNLSTDMDLDTIISKLVKGGKDRNTVRFTIPEGYELEQMAEKLAKEGIIDKDRFIQLSSDKKNFEEEFSFLKQLEKGQSLEGFLFPSTYEIFTGTKEEEIIGKMLHEFEKIYEKDLESKLTELNMTLNEAVTLASIVEREGKVDEERPLMSAVFLNRIEKGMMLQSCATVQYVLGERKEVLSNADTRIDSPYNTYINEGLPPGPIASPGEESLVAAVNPADVDYLFFVLTGNGTHTFTKTYEEHLQAKPKK